MRLGFGTPECRFCRFGVGFFRRGVQRGVKRMARRGGAWGGLRHTPLQHSIVHVTSHRGDANSAATMAGCAMPCIEKMRVAKGLALGLTVSKAADLHEALWWRARQHSAARRVARRGDCVLGPNSLPRSERTPAATLFRLSTAAEVAAGRRRWPLYRYRSMPARHRQRCALAAWMQLAVSGTLEHARL